MTWNIVTTPWTTINESIKENERRSFIKLLFLCTLRRKFASYFPSLDSWILRKWRKCPFSLIQVDASRNEMNRRKEARMRNYCGTNWIINQYSSRLIFYFKLRLIIIPRGLKIKINGWKSVLERTKLGFCRGDEKYLLRHVRDDSRQLQKKSFTKCILIQSIAEVVPREDEESLISYFFSHHYPLWIDFLKKRTRLPYPLSPSSEICF